MVLYTIELDVKVEADGKRDYFYRYTDHSSGEVREADSLYVILKGMAKDSGYYLRKGVKANGT